MTTPMSKTNNDLFAQATDWFIRVRDANATPEDCTAWLEWVEADPAHRIAFDEVLFAWGAVGKVQPLPWPTPAELAQPHPDDFVHVIAARRSPALALHRRRRPVLRWAGAGLAASLVAAAVLPSTQAYRARAWYAMTHTASETIDTDHGEPRAALLPDGSRVELGGATGVQLQFTPEQRVVKAAEGEVFYRVKHDTRRPFIVEAGPVSVTAVGTAFAVRREGGTVAVTVTEGIVDIRTDIDSPGAAPRRARAGERVLFDNGKVVAKAEPSSQDGPAIGWQRGQLRFEDEPLRAVVASLNRYADKPIVLADPALGDLHFTGTVFEDSTHDWLAAVPRLFPVAVEDMPDRTLLKRR